LKNNVGRMKNVWLPITLYNMTEETCKKLRMLKSSFYRYATTRLLEQINVLSTRVKENTLPANQGEAETAVP
jgi:hypothetical protein